MSDIFISYAREDRPQASAIAAALAAQGWSVWWDREIRAGGNIADVIEEEIARARCLLVLWSAVSIKRDWVNDEAREGKDRNILVPVLIEDVRPPLGFRSMHAANLTGWQHDAKLPAFQRLCEDIASLIGPGAKSEPHGVEPAPVHRFVTDWQPEASQRLNRKWALGGLALVVVALVWIGVSRLQPTAHRLTNPKDGPTYLWIQPGEFWMGAVPGDTEAISSEKPRHRVRITKGFWLAETLVTVAAYERFVSERPIFRMPPAPAFNLEWARRDHPIVNVTWQEAKSYCEWAGGRLPTEAEWEYAARAGQDGLKYPWGNQITPADANYAANKWRSTSSVRSYPPNAWRLFDMAGNVWQWVSDWYDERYYATLSSTTPMDDPRGPPSGPGPALRGGSFEQGPRELRASHRGFSLAIEQYPAFGFRCVREVAP